MAQHSASVAVNAPVHHVYTLFSHFNDYPKFMTYVKEVTYLDDQRSHWVVDVIGRHEWDAVNNGWVADREIGWRSTSGVQNSGRITFEPQTADVTLLTAVIDYTPPAGAVGQTVEALGGGAQFEERLTHDLQHFAQMVADAPPGALDPTSSTYLFHAGSAAAKGQTTRAQDQTMGMSDILADDGSGLGEGADAPEVPGTSARDVIR